MYKKKQRPGGSKRLFVVLLLMLSVIFSIGCVSATDYTDYYKFDSGDLLRAYQFWRQQSVDFYPEYYSEASSVMSIWNEADKVFSGELVRNWEIIADSLNQALYTNFNSKTATADYEDRNLLCLFIPSMNLGTIGASGQQVMWFMFIPYPYRTLQVTESRGSQVVSGQTEYYYSFQARLCDTSTGTINTNISNVTNNFLLMSVPLNTSQPIGFATKEGTNNTFFGQWGKYYRSKFSWGRPHIGKVYGYGLFKTFRDYIEANGCQISYHSYENMSGLYTLSRIYYYFDMENNTMYDDENAPQEPSSGDSSGDNQNEGLTSGDFLVVSLEVNNDYWGSSGDLDGTDQEAEIQAGINDLLSASGDMMPSAYSSGLDSVEQGFMNLLREKNPGEMDFVISWPDISFSTFGVTPIKLISGDSINFSALCRSHSDLGSIKDTLSIILDFFFGFSLLKYAYNLVLSTLGIDNPYLYEDENDTTVDILDDDTSHTTVVTYSEPATRSGGYRFRRHRRTRMKWGE